jgi:prevent-host-death family protein
LPVTARPIRQVPLAELEADLARYLRLARTEEIVITRRGKPAGVLVGFKTQDDWLDYRLENHPEFLKKLAAARRVLRAGKGIKIEDLRP